MKDNKELFDYLNIKEDSKEARQIDALSGSIDKAIAENAPQPSRAVIDAIMAKAERKNKFAIKNIFFAFNYKYALAGLAVVAMLFTWPLMTRNHTTIDTEIFTYQTYLDFDNFDEDLNEIFLELENI